MRSSISIQAHELHEGVAVGKTLGAARDSGPMLLCWWFHQPSQS